MNHAMHDVSEGYLTVAAIRHVRACQEKLSGQVMAMLKFQVANCASNQSLILNNHDFAATITSLIVKNEPDKP